MELKIREFRKKIRDYYRNHGRDLPWRKTHDPYKILVSEIMLQQTQVGRVIEKYQSFIRKFSTFQRLAASDQRSVLQMWQGLGYNRRARFLWLTAQKVTKDYQGKLPGDSALLQKLPGIGEGTAGAILAFAFNKPSVFIETNIRSVYIHEFYNNKKNISDANIIKLIELTVDQKNPREWYYALMDYGSMLKQKVDNPSRKSKHHARQSKFNGSLRQVRGEIIKVLTRNGKISVLKMIKRVEFPQKKVLLALAGLKRDGLVRQSGTQIIL